MAMNLGRARSIGWASVLLLAAVGCGVEQSAEPGQAQAQEIESRAGALGCDTSSIQGVCLSQCQGTCTNGSAIGACMSVCIGNYCAAQTFVPNERCGSPAYWPEPTIPAPESRDGCESDLWLSCESMCDACAAPAGRQSCKQTCHVKWCPGGAVGSCRDQHRFECRAGRLSTPNELGCFRPGLTSEQYRACMAQCFDQVCPPG